MVNVEEGWGQVGGILDDWVGLSKAFVKAFNCCPWSFPMLCLDRYESSCRIKCLTCSLDVCPDSIISSGPYIYIYMYVCM
jgi:hypothetical protein